MSHCNHVFPIFVIFCDRNMETFCTLQFIAGFVILKHICFDIFATRNCCYLVARRQVRFAGSQNTKTAANQKERERNSCSRKWKNGVGDDWKSETVVAGNVKRVIDNCAAVFARSEKKGGSVWLRLLVREFVNICRDLHQLVTTQHSKEGLSNHCDTLCS